MSNLSNTVQQARNYHISDIPKRSAQRHPHKLALVDGNTRLTYQQLHDQVEQLAAYLLQMGLKKSDRLLLFSHNCWQFPIIHFAAARIGVLTVPVNFMLNAQELAYIIENSKTQVIFAEDQLTPTVDEALAQAKHQLIHFYQIPLNF